MKLITAQEIHERLDWSRAIEALRKAHRGPRPMIDDYYLSHDAYGLFSRGVILPGFGAGVKIASIFPGNLSNDPPRPVEQAAFVVIDEQTKDLTALFDGPAITAWKTAADSALAASVLSRENSEVLLVLGAGPIARALVEAYLHIRPSIRRVLLWNRTEKKLYPLRDELMARGMETRVVEDLDGAVAQADIIVAATASCSPCVKGRHVREGTHVDLVGGYRPDMQEGDGDLIAAARLFVDDRQSALNSGDLQIPLREGLITEADIEGDLFDLCQDLPFTRALTDITLYKNAGGAHLDLAVCHYLLEQSGTC